MMDTILNLGMNDESVLGLAEAGGGERFAYDSYRRFIQMFGDVVAGVDAHLFENALQRLKLAQRRGGRRRSRRRANCEQLVGEFRAIYEAETGEPFPQDPQVQLCAVDRGRLPVVEHAARPHLPPRVPHRRRPGHRGQRACRWCSATWATTRRPASPSRATRRPVSPSCTASTCDNAQGEDVVAGIRTPQPLAEMESEMPQSFRQLAETMQLLERHYREMQDIEFTIERGTLYLLQTRTGKRTAAAALKVARDLVDEGLISRDEALERIDPDQLDQLLHPTIDPSAERDVIAHGLNASPGAAVGAVVFDADTAEARGKDGQEVILVRVETTPDDIHGRRRRAGRADRSRRHDLARGRGRTRAGQAVRGGRRGDRRRRRGRAVPRGRRRGARGRRDHDRRRARRGDARRRCRWCRRRSTRTSARSPPGRTRCGGCASAPTPTRRPTRPRRASWAPRASASAAPSTCSSATSGCRWCSA